MSKIRILIYFSEKIFKTYILLMLIISSCIIVWILLFLSCMHVTFIKNFEFLKNILESVYNKKRKKFV